MRRPAESRAWQEGEATKPPARPPLVQVPVGAETRPVPGTLLREAFHGSPLPRGERPSCHGGNRRPFRTGPEHIHVSSAGSPFSTCASTRHSSQLSSYVHVFPRRIPSATCCSLCQSDTCSISPACPWRGPACLLFRVF